MSNLANLMQNTAEAHNRQADELLGELEGMPVWMDRNAFEADGVIAINRVKPHTDSTGPIPTSNPWDAFADDQLGLMDHLGIDRFLFIGYCIGGCFAGKLLQRAPDRVVAVTLRARCLSELERQDRSDAGTRILRYS